MPKLATPELCCGCAACANACSHEAISMHPNEEGFLHPVIDNNKCVNCSLCEKVCPGLTPAISQNQNPLAFAVQNRDEGIRYQSTSGGAFSAIAEYVIEHNGVVFGAAMSTDFSVKHIHEDNIDGLAKFRNSKYVQSSIGYSYKEVKDFLLQGKLVCFSGTPCQVNGLHKYLGRDYENLISIDVVCKSIPSPLVFRKYIEFKSKPEEPFKEIVFRDKKRGFLYCTMALYSSSHDKVQRNSQYRRGSESDEWLRLFLSGRISRKSCFSCHYQTLNRPSDFTLGDIWETGNSQFDDNKGSTLMHVWTKKGKDILDCINDKITCIQYAIEKSRGVSRKNSISIYQDRDQLFSDANNLSPDEFFHKYAPYNLIIKSKQIGRYLLYKAHLQSFVRRLKHFVIHQ